ncbi:hypothetical protein RN001_011379 [Aquatica leii]|uniref:Uncharacterized protein n=1 Tax=Aquatica leii TaxID=1421715 RepID=A0AAN7P925_9COLE|nr:hypothetical protein RN001_011379 [Aquatica leii]
MVTPSTSFAQVATAPARIPIQAVQAIGPKIISIDVKELERELLPRLVDALKAVFALRKDSTEEVTGTKLTLNINRENKKRKNDQRTIPEEKGCIEGSQPFFSQQKDTNMVKKPRGWPKASRVDQALNMLFSNILTVITVFGSLTLGKKLPDTIIHAWANAIEPYYDNCLLESGLTQKDVWLMNENIYAKKASCYIKCLYLKLNFFKPDENFDTEFITSKYPFITQKLSKRCAQEAASKSDLCEKSFIFANCVVGALLLPDTIKQSWINLIEPYINECQQESSMDQKDLSKLNNDADVPKSKETGCYLKCVYQKLKFFKPDEEFDTEFMTSELSYLPKEMSKKCVEEASSKSDLCDKSLVFGNFIIKALNFVELYMLYTYLRRFLVSRLYQFLNMLLPNILAVITVFGSLTLSKKLPDAIVQTWTKAIVSFYDNCLLESKVNEKDLSIMLNEGYLPKTKEAGCYLKCVYLRLKFLNSEGSFDSNLITAEEPYITREISKKCMEEAASKNDLCEKSYTFGSCVIEALVI